LVIDRHLIGHLSADANNFLRLTLSVNQIVAWEALSKSGSLVRESSRAAMKAQRHNWVKYLDKKGKVRFHPSKDKTKQLGLRQSEINALVINPNSMAAMINSYLMEKHNTVIVGGRMRRFQPLKIDNGEIKGRLPAVSGVSKSTYALLDKMESGKLTGDYKTYFGNKDKEVTEWGFMKKGIASSAGGVNAIFANEYSKMLNRALANRHREANNARAV